MIVDANDEDGWKYKIMDLDTNKEIELVVWADDETGEYEQCKTNRDGSIVYDKYDEIKMINKKGNIKLEKID